MEKSDGDNGLGNIWTKCPLSAANEIMKTGKIKIGWTIARAEILTPRPLQCYKCWEFGHVKYSCTSKIDRSQQCYTCGSTTHRAQACSITSPKCVICEEKGLNNKHRIGSAMCSMDKFSNRGRPLPRIRREELEARNSNKPKATEVTKEDPDRRTTEIAMDIDHAVLSQTDSV